MTKRQERQLRAIQRLTRATGLELSEHAVLRARELGYGIDEVYRCVARPDQTYVCSDGSGARRMYQRGQLSVVVDEPARVAVTVLPRTGIDWRHGRDTRRSLFAIPA
jgi:hypothetical protein